MSAGGQVRVSTRAAGPLCVLVAAAAIFAFLPALDGWWLSWDDEINFVDNPHFRGLGARQLAWMLTTTQLAVYQPLSWMTLGANYVFGGLDPWGYHLVNLVLHGAAAALFFLVAARLLRAGLGPTAGDEAVLAGALAAGLVFAVHPLRAESVAWVTERRDVLCGALYLAAVLAYLRGVEGGGGLRGTWRAVSLGAFAAAIAAKGLAITLPLSLLVLDVYPLRRAGALGWARLVREKLPFAVLAALGAVAALWAVSRDARWTGYAEQGPDARVAMIAYSLWFYPSRLVWPVGLSPYYEMPERIALTEGRFLGPVLAVLAVTVLLVAARRRWPAGLAAWTHSAIALAPVSGAVHAGAQLAHDRFSYLSGLGFALAAGGAVAWLVVRWRRRAVSGTVAGAAAAVGALGVLALAAGAWEQSKVWRNSESLWWTAAATDPACALCRVNLGNVLYGQRRFREAEAAYRAAVALRPRRPEPHNNLGIALAAQGRYAEAEPAFREALRLSPDMAGALANLGTLYADQQRWNEAAPLLRRAIELGPDTRELRATMVRVDREAPARVEREESASR
ncbi:MAG: tetratricopeptide repeat protein [Candidatus Rokuibacteriota bacterium]